MRQTLLRLTALCIFASSVGQCGPDAVGVRVHVKNLTPDISSLHVNAILDGKPATQGVEFTQQLSQFTIKVPISAIGSGKLIINVAGLASDHCKLSAGRIDTLIMRGNAYVEQELNLVLLPSKVCTLINQIIPPFGPAEGGTTLQLDGQNFAEGTSVTIDGTPATDVVVLGPDRLTAILPARLGGFGKALVVVSTPDGQTISRNDLFSYYASHIDFSISTLTAGASPRTIALGDFNSDHIADLVVTNNKGNNVSTFLGNGHGGFAAATNYPGGNTPVGVVAGDFNRDGNLDLILGNNGASVNYLSLLLGNGSGGFGSAENITCGSQPVWVATADLNGDKISDLVSANNQGNNISILLGNVMGGFSSPTNFQVGMSPVSLAVGLFDAGQTLDLAVVNSNSDNVSILLGDGLGGFGAATNFSTGNRPYSVVAGEFNGDQKPDLAIVNRSSSNVSVLFGSGTGGFSSPANFSVATTPIFVAAGDLNGDQILDLVTASDGGGSISILLGKGYGLFNGAINILTGSEKNPSGIVISDFNGDKKPDLALAGYATNSVVILTNNSY